MKILPIINNYILDGNLPEFRDHSRLYPSSASVVVGDPVWGKVVEGACMRSEFYRMTGTPPDPIPTDAAARTQLVRGSRVAMYGDPIATLEIAKLRAAGVPVLAEEHRFFLKTWRLSGRVDAIVADAHNSWTNLGLEIKSTGQSGFRFVSKKPKAAHVLQVMVYASAYGPDVPNWKILYFCREPSAWDPVEFDIRIMEDGHVSVNGQRWEGYTIAGIYERYALLLRYVDAASTGEQPIPPRDFDAQFSPERLQKMASSGMLSKTDAAAVRKGKAVKKGDWQCAYCRYKDRCAAEAT